MTSRPFSITPRQALYTTLRFIGWQIFFGICYAVPLEILSKIPLTQAWATDWRHGPMFIILINCSAWFFLLRQELGRALIAWRDLGGWRLRPLVLLLSVLLLVAGVKILASELDNLTRHVLVPPEAFTRLAQTFSDRAHYFSGPFLLILVAGVTEETIFRGLLLQGLLRKLSPWKAILVSAALFGLMHVNPWQAITAAFFGLVLGWVYYRTQSLGWCTLMHGAGNGSTLLIKQLPFHILGFNPPQPSAVVSFQPWWLDASGLALLTLGLWWCHRLTLQHRPEWRIVGPEAAGPGNAVIKPLVS